MESLTGRMRHGLKAHFKRVVSTGTLCDEKLNIKKRMFFKKASKRVAPRVIVQFTRPGNILSVIPGIFILVKN